MTPTQVSIQLTNEQTRQIEYLRQAGFGTRSGIIRTAIDRMYREEHNTDDTEHTTDRIGKVGSIDIGNSD